LVGGGCSGLQYVMDLVDGRRSGIFWCQRKTFASLSIQKSALFVSGSVLDYSEDLAKRRL